MEMITLPKIEFEKMQEELRTLKNAKLYKKLLEFEKNLMDGKAYTRKDLGF